MVQFWWQVSVTAHGAAVISSAIGGGIVGNEQRFTALALVLFVAAAALITASIYAHSRRLRSEFPELR